MERKLLIITTPRGTLYQDFKNQYGDITAKLEWNSGFGEKYTGNFNRAQRYVDSEVLRRCAPLVPFQTGMLYKSGELGTVIGSGEVSYIAPYAAFQYYKTARTRDYDDHRGAFWFERMKAKDKGTILRGAARLSGGGK
jgi:hypothetical protein